MWAMVAKEFRQLRRDRRTVAMMIVLPVVLLVVFGYAASFNVSSIPTVVVGPDAGQAAAALHAPFDVTQVDPAAGRSEAQSQLQDGKAVVAVVTGGPSVQVLMDGTQLFSVQAAQTALATMAQARPAGSPAPPVSVQILYNPKLIAGKIAPYLMVAAVDLVLIVGVGMGLFHVPFVGNVATFALGAALFLLVTLGMGVLISTVSQNQGQAIQLAFMIMLPQVLLSGLIFPITSMAAGVRWISYVLPLTYFIQISRGVMLKATPITALWPPLGLLALLAVVVLGLAIIRFRRDLAPSARSVRRGEARASESVAA
jgi:ABC-2 type transport system permease protein